MCRLDLILTLEISHAEVGALLEVTTTTSRTAPVYAGNDEALSGEVLLPAE